MAENLDKSPAASAVFQQLDRNESFPYRKSEYLRRFAWLAVQATLYRFSPNRLPGWRRWLLRLFGAKIANRAAVNGKTHIMHPWLLEIGEWSCLAGGVSVYNLGPIKIGAHTVISQDAYLCAGTHDYTNPAMPLVRPPINIGSGVWICAGAFIGPDVTIGDNCVIAAKAVVTKDIPAGMIAGGNPCRVIKKREQQKFQEPNSKAQIIPNE